MHPWRGCPTVSGRPVAPVLLKSIKLIFCTRWHTINIPINSGLDSLLSNHPKSWPNSIVFRRPSSSIRSSDSVRIPNEEGIRSRFALHRTSGTLPPKLYGGPGELQRSHTECSPNRDLQFGASKRSAPIAAHWRVCITKFVTHSWTCSVTAWPSHRCPYHRWTHNVYFSHLKETFFETTENVIEIRTLICAKKKSKLARFSLLSQNFWSF